MKKLLTGACFLALATSLPAHSAATSGNNYWSASADTVGSPFHAGIVVTDSTYADCVTQFSAAMSNHSSAHGDVFTNIQNCHYVSTSFGGGLVGIAQAHQEINYVNGGIKPLPHNAQTALEEKFIEEMSSLEAQYQVSEFLKKRDTLIEQYANRMKDTTQKRK